MTISECTAIKVQRLVLPLKVLKDKLMATIKAVASATSGTSEANEDKRTPLAPSTESSRGKKQERKK